MEYVTFTYFKQKIIFISHFIIALIKSHKIQIFENN